MNKQRYIELRDDLMRYEDNLRFYQCQLNRLDDQYEYWTHHIEQTKKMIAKLKKAIDKEIGL